MIGIVQISYLGLFLLDVTDPLVTPLDFLKYSNGFNNILPNPAADTPKRIQNTGYYVFVLDNINIMLVFVLIPMILGTWFLIMSRMSKRPLVKTISYYKLCLG